MHIAAIAQQKCQVLHYLLTISQFPHEAESACIGTCQADVEASKAEEGERPSRQRAARVHRDVWLCRYLG